MMMRRAVRRSGHGAAPAILLIPALIGLAFLLLPVIGLLARTPWTELLDRLAAPAVGEALLLSLQCATLATVVCVVLGAPLGWLLARDFPGGRVARALVTVPLVLPPVVGGVALLLMLGRRGIVGQYLDAWFGVSLPFTTAGVVVAEAFVAMPFLVIAVEGAVRSTDPRHAEAAATLGASSWTTFRRVTLPSIMPSLMSGIVLCWSRALGEFGATITFAGNFPGETTTMPLAVYIAMETDPQAAIVLSVVLLTVSVTVLIGLRHRWIGAPESAAGVPR